MTTVKVGDEEIRLEPFSGRKAIRVIRTIESISKGVPEILDRWADFTRDYEARNVTEMDRATAKHYYSPQPLMDEEPILIEGSAVTDEMGNVIVRRTPKLGVDGKPVMGADPLAHMSDTDWAASGNKLRLPRSPSNEEKIAAIFPMALDLAEHEVTTLLALLATSNGDLKRKARDGSLKEFLEARAEELLDAPATDLLELAVGAGEMVEEQFTNKVKTLGDRLPNALRLLGITRNQKPEEDMTLSPESSETKPTSSTDSPKPTDGMSEPPLTEPVGSSSSSSAID